MSRNNGEAELYKNRCAGCRHNAVVRGGGNAHAEDNAADHCQKKSYDGRVLCNTYDSADKLVCKSRYGDAACYDTCHSAGNGNGDSALAARNERVKRRIEALYCAAFKSGAEALARFSFLILGGYEVYHTYDKRCAYRDSGRGSHRLCARGNEPYEQHEGKHEVAVLSEVAPLGKLRLRNAFKSELFRFEVNRDENAREVEYCGENSLYRNG